MDITIKPTNLNNLEFHSKVNLFLENQNYEKEYLSGKYEYQSKISGIVYKAVINLDSDTNSIRFYKRDNYFPKWEELPLNYDEQVALRSLIRKIEEGARNFYKIERERKRDNF